MIRGVRLSFGGDKVEMTLRLCALCGSRTRTVFLPQRRKAAKKTLGSHPLGNSLNRAGAVFHQFVLD